MISQLSVVDQDLRINIGDVSKQIWIIQMEMEVTKMVQAKIKLSHLTPNQIVAYVLSAKGKLLKTAGTGTTLGSGFLSI